MYKKIILVSSFICLSINFQSVAQSVKTNLYVTLIPCDSIHFNSCHGSHIADVTQEFVMEKYTKDTLFLKLEHILNPFHSFMYPRYYQKLTVDIISKNKKQSLEVNFDGRNLSVPLPTSSCTVKLNYFFSSDYTTRSLNSNAPLYVWSCRYLQQSWYFSCPDMQINKMEFCNPYDSLLYLCVAVPTFLQNGKIVLDTQNTNTENIDFYLFEKPFFHKTTCIEGTNTINIYLDRGVSLIPTPGAFWNNIILPGNRATQVLEDSCKNFISHALQKIKTIFPPLQKTVIDIFDADLGVNETLAWGTSVPDRKNKHHMILIDTAFWHDQYLMHELIHLYNPVPYSKDDSTYYFFSESITEYLAVCFRYEDRQERELVFNYKISFFAKEPNEDYSIFKLSSNERDVNTARGTSVVIYDKTPFILHTFALIVGEEKFHAALKQFYAKVAEGMVINLPNFEQTLKENGITNKQWDWLMRNL